jgi:DNA-3-methyladenine glycosylase
MKGIKRVPESFFDREPRTVSRELLGKVLIRNSPHTPLRGRIVEVEAYLGTDDLAAHAAAGLTARTAVIFGPPGRAYVYFIYGVHYCLNFSCLPSGEAGCVLIRALEPLAGLEAMAAARGMDTDRLTTTAGRKQLTSGPGRLCQAFGITRERDNGKNVTSSNSDLRVMDDGFIGGKIKETARIGIRKSADLPLRYFLEGNTFVSGNRSG